MLSKEMSLERQLKTVDKRLQELRDERIRIRDELDDLKHKPVLDNLVGTYWKYRNSYSCPQSDKDYWWMFAKVIRIIDSGSICLLKAQIDSEDRMSVKEETWPYSTNPEKPLSGWIEIDESEFMDAWDAIEQRLESYGLGCAYT